jgi:hypothetical protein
MAGGGERDRQSERGRRLGSTPFWEFSAQASPFGCRSPHQLAASCAAMQLGHAQAAPLRAHRLVSSSGELAASSGVGRGPLSKTWAARGSGSRHAAAQRIEHPPLRKTCALKSWKAVLLSAQPSWQGPGAAARARRARQASTAVGPWCRALWGIHACRAQQSPCATHQHSVAAHGQVVGGQSAAEAAAHYHRREVGWVPPGRTQDSCISARHM